MDQLKNQRVSKSCSPQEEEHFKFLIKNSETRKEYIKGIDGVLKKVYSDKWVEETDDTLSGFYNIESEGRSVVNNINTNYTAFCTLSKLVNKEILKIGKPDKVFVFTLANNKTVSEVSRFIRALDYFKDNIFTFENPEYKNLIRLMKVIWDKGQKSELIAESKLKTHFGDKITVTKIGDHGSKVDALNGVDLKITSKDKTHTAQVKLYSSIVENTTEISFIDTGNVKQYATDWMIFVNNKSFKTYIMKNNPVKNGSSYIFSLDSILKIID